MSATDWLELTEPAAPFEKGSVAERFVVPPFSILDTMTPEWRARKHQWLALGIQSELGRGMAAGQTAIPVSGSAGLKNAEIEATRRGQGALYGGTSSVTNVMLGPGRAMRVDMMRGEKSDRYDYVQRAHEEPAAPGTSIFDPVLTELVYRWFAPPGGSVLDPFAGGSVRGIVASHLGHPYTGIDLSAPQVAANYSQHAIGKHPFPTWMTGDSAKVIPDLAPEQFDLLFTCPPYFDLEVYSNDPADLSNAGSYASFMASYRRIISEAVGRLRQDRFAVIVVSEVRDMRTKDGTYHGFVPDTIKAFTDAGLAYYNEAILVNAIGSLPLRITKHFEAGRKLGRRHQNILVFLNGSVPRGWDYAREAPDGGQLALF